MKRIVSIIVLVSGILLPLFYYNKKENYDYDIIVVGSGLAGLVSAYESNILSNGKARIIVLEKEIKYGGNSMKATSGINILNSPIQFKNKIEDSFQTFYDDTMIASRNISNSELVSTLVKDSTNIFEFYKRLGVDLSKIGILGGHSVPRTHRPENTTVGFTLTSTVFKELNKTKNVTIVTNATVYDLIYDSFSNTVKGVRYMINGKNRTLKAKSIILASGGYAHDFATNDPGYNSLLQENAPELMKYPTTNGPSSKGMGVKMARKIGADTVDMDKLQVHPTGWVDPSNRFNKLKILAPELIRGVGAILLNQKGKRFVNELGPRDYVTKKIIENCEKAKNDTIEQYESFILLNQKGVDEFGKNIKFYIGKGFLKKYDNFSTFAKAFNVSEETLKKTIEQYNKSFELKKDEFGKTVFKTKFNYNEPIYGGMISPSLHYSMGGLKISKDGEVLKKDGTPIKSLYGAGEVTGGVHGGNRLGGNSLLECSVYGIRAARSAVKNLYILKK